MIVKILEFWCGPDGKLSSMRFNATVVTATACFGFLWAVTHNALSVELIGAVGSMLAVAFGFKAWQQKNETPNGVPANAPQSGN